MNKNYTELQPADALAHLNETLAAEIERFEKDLGLTVASIKVKRDKESEELKLQVQVR